MNTASLLERVTDRTERRMDVRGGLDLEVVVVACDRRHALEETVHALHRRLSAQNDRSWLLTVADNASVDATWTIAEELAAELPNVEARHLAVFVGRRQLRTLWAGSPATTVVFVVLSRVGPGPRSALAAGDLLAPVLRPIRPVTTLAGSPTASVVPVARRCHRRLTVGASSAAARGTGVTIGTR